MPSRLKKENSRSSNKRKPKSRVKRFFLLSLIIVGGGTLLVQWRLHYLERVVEEQFNVTRRWDIPSRIYSDAFYIYPDIDIQKQGLITKLERLGYRRVEKEIQGPGEFLETKDHIDLYLHNFEYPQESFVGFSVRLEIVDNIVKSLSDLETEEHLSLVRLEPEEIATLFDAKMEDRTLITLKDVPQHLLEAVILIEDERFFKHKGVDPLGIGRALVKDLLAMKIVQGGSTLTQQLVKNFFLTSKKTVGRKVNEVLMALILERKYSKGEILEAYLNEIYLGQRGPSSVTGVAEAAKHYFAKNIGQITVGEAALLAGMIKNPSEYSPIRNKEKAAARRNFVLKRMFEAKVMDEETYKLALSQEIVTPKPKIKPIVAPYFIDFVKQQISDLYPDGILTTEGLRIFTTLDMNLQLKGQQNLENGLADLEKKYGKLLPKDSAGLLQGCLLVLSPQNAYIRAMVGGRDYGASQFNRCTQAMRQPGSTFKPFVYLTALDPDRSRKTFTLVSLLEDHSLTLDTPQGKWTPQNYDKKEHGMVTLREALENSYNIPTVRLALEAGLVEVVKTARDAGITSALSPFPSMALGSFEVTPLEMSMAYTIFPNLGLKPEPLSIMQIVNRDKEILEKKNLKVRRVFEKGPVALVHSVLQGVVDRGTAAGLKSYGLSDGVAGKTGTTSNYKDAWFIGYTIDLLGLVWVGFDDNAPLQMSGARAALPIWGNLMKQVVQSPQPFSLPEEIIAVDVGPCANTYKEYFIEGTEQNEPCSHGKAF